MPVITTIEDLHRIYKRRAPKMFYDYCQSGSWTEQTFRDNTDDFAKIRLRQAGVSREAMECQSFELRCGREGRMPRSRNSRG